jgi:hypothetical protein
MLEVKTKGRRGSTVKHRLPVAPTGSWRTGETGSPRSASGVARHGLDDDARCFVATVLHDYDGRALPELRPVLTTAYRRLTLVDLDAGTRLTCDVDLAFAEDGQVIGMDDVVIAESKVAARSGAADRLLLSLGARPVRLSKYAMGTALLHPELPANPWSRALRRHTSWSRACPTGQVDRLAG